MPLFQSVSLLLPLLKSSANKNTLQQRPEHSGGFTITRFASSTCSGATPVAMAGKLFNEALHKSN
ncbi:hypothetical protein [Desulfatirhabdium butyrativorans]|uniref:hypothetical protein n=1 Tax=Desulfatirhabdium butyrativorans TaxID=340467 RepID=UPI0012EB1766|nr:hypothetical protein [Desulfatirhabdium butyrativorans]